VAPTEGEGLQEVAGRGEEREQDASCEDQTGRLG
jgi:hypothetical protein